MIQPDKRRAVYLLHDEGMKLKEISRRLKISRNSVRKIIEQNGEMPLIVRKDKVQIDQELLRQLYRECDGRAQRVFEKLVEEEKFSVTYPTLTRLLREYEIGKPSKGRCDQKPDVPGEEMQHDTSDYRIDLGDKKVKVIASVLYLRYSKRRYLKFYRAFNRFKMKCFFHEALMYWRYSAKECIIDNTNLARHYGTGKNAVIVPEMEIFSKQYEFTFICHEVHHSNRKAGNERSFFTVETNFFPGRKFSDMEDLNQQAFDWSTNRMEHRPQGKARLIPAKAFEHECSFLEKVSPHIPPPYLIHTRITDQYGYISFAANYYWVPGTRRDEVKVLQYSDQVRVYQDSASFTEYALPPDGVKNVKFSPKGMPTPRHQPKNRRRPTHEEEKRLRTMDGTVIEYLDFALSTVRPNQRHRLVRELFSLSRQVSSSLFIQVVARALRYRITCFKTIRRIARLYLCQEARPLPRAELDEQYHEREAYQEGSLSDTPDLSLYDKLLEDEDG